MNTPSKSPRASSTLGDGVVADTRSISGASPAETDYGPDFTPEMIASALQQLDRLTILRDHESRTIGKLHLIYVSHAELRDDGRWNIRIEGVTRTGFIIFNGIFSCEEELDVLICFNGIVFQFVDRLDDDDSHIFRFGFVCIKPDEAFTVHLFGDSLCHFEFTDWFEL